MDDSIKDLIRRLSPQTIALLAIYQQSWDAALDAVYADLLDSNDVMSGAERMQLAAMLVPCVGVSLRLLHNVRLADMEGKN